jgi:hypothetical protein
MKPDELLNDLGRLARTQEEQAASGERDADEILRPLDAAAHERIAARVLPLVQAGRLATGGARDEPSSETVPRRSRSWRRIMATIPALVAAAVLLWWFWPRTDAPLPMYALELHGGRSIERGADAAAIIRVGSGDRVSAVLRPATAVSAPLAVRIFVDGRALPDAPMRVVEQSPAGALRISGLGPALAALTPGRHRLQFAVGRPGSLPQALADALIPAEAVVGDVQLLSHEVERLGP